MTAQELIRTLPEDWDSPARALSFQQFLEKAEADPNALQLAESVYHIAATAEWPAIPLYDLNMLFYGARCHPKILRKVQPDLERIVTSVMGGPPLHPIWDMIHQRG